MGEEPSTVCVLQEYSQSRTSLININNCKTTAGIWESASKKPCKVGNQRDNTAQQAPGWLLWVSIIK